MEEQTMQPRREGSYKLPIVLGVIVVCLYIGTLVYHSIV